MNDAWIAERMGRIDASGIRKVFDLAQDLSDPVNLSIGQPDFDVPQPVKAAAIEAIEAGHNGYTVTQGIAPLRDAIGRSVRAEYDHPDRQLLITSGTSGALMLALLATVNPGDEVIVFDPYFVMYKHLVTLAGGRSVFVDTYPSFRIDLAQVEAVIGPRTKAILLNSPANPTGAVASAAEVRGLAELARRHDLLVISDEIYRIFCYDAPFASPARWNDQVLVVDGFSKAYGMTGWRLGFAHGPGRIIQEMAKLQQFSFVCAPSIAQYGGVAAWGCDMSEAVATYRRKRDLLVEGLYGLYDLTPPGGAFYLFPRAPWGTATEFVAEAIRHNLLIIPGTVFSRADTHFRISYAASDAMIHRGVEILRRLAGESMTGQAAETRS